MREIIGSREPTMLGYYRSILEQAEIPCFIRYDHAAALSELQGPAFYPVLCVDDEFYQQAMDLLRPHYDMQRQSDREVFQDWVCESCGENVPGAFDVCWNCEAPRSPALG
jgi:hypothetical protein